VSGPARRPGARAAVLAGLVLVASLALALRLAPARADGGLHATGRVPSAAPGPALAVALTGGYAYSGVVLDTRDAHHRVGGGLAAAWRLVPWLELGLDVRGRYDRHTGDEPDSGLAGEPRLWLRAARAVGDGLWLGARAGVWLPGASAPSVQLDATTVDGAALVTWAPSATRLSAMLGFRLDRSRNAIDFTLVSRPDRVGLGWSDADAILAGIELARRAGRWQGRAELSGELRVGGVEDTMVGALTSPLRLELGVRRALTSALTLEAAADLGLSQRPASDSFGGVTLYPIEPRLAATIGLAWRQPARAPRVVPIVEPAPPDVVEPEPPPPPPPATGTLRGRVLDEDGAPLPGAVINVGVRTATTGDDGTFTIAGLTPGAVEVAIERPGHAPVNRTFTVAADVDGAPGPAAPDVTLARVRPPSQIRGVIRDFEAHGLAATVRIEPLGLEVIAGADGSFAVDVPPGAYRVVVDMPGFASQTRRVTVEEEGVAITNIELRKARR
jgi:hypothetical protein